MGISLFGTETFRQKGTKYLGNCFKKKHAYQVSSSNIQLRIACIPETFYQKVSIKEGSNFGEVFQKRNVLRIKFYNYLIGSSRYAPLVTENVLACPVIFSSLNRT